MADNIVHERTCCRCKESKPLSEYYRNSKKPDGTAVQCRTCAKTCKTRRPLIEIFWSKVRKTDTCWFWTGRIKAGPCGGYGELDKNCKAIGAHRFMWEITFGEIPKGLFVLHKCDVRHCVNPAHLFLGSKKDNFDDMVSKHRQGPEFVQCQTQSKLTPEIVKTARELYASGRFTHAELAKRFGVATATLQQAVQGRHWRHVA